MYKQVDTEKFIVWLVAWSIHGHSEIWIVMIDAMTADDMIRGDTMSMEVAISWQWLFSLMSNGKSKPLEVLGFPGCWMEIWRKWKFDGFESCTVHDWFLLRRKKISSMEIGKKEMDEKVGASISKTGSANVSYLVGLLKWLVTWVW